MDRITNNKNWNVCVSNVGRSSKEYFVLQKDLDKNISFVNDKSKAMKVCEALNKAKVN